MENFFIDDKFYRDLEFLMDDLNIENPSEELEDGWKLDAIQGTLEPLCELDEHLIFDAIVRKYEHRFAQDSETTDDQVLDALRKGIDFVKVNTLMPELYYDNGGSFVITKSDLIEYCS